MSQSVIAATIAQLVRSRIHDLADLALTITGQGEYLVNVTVNGPQNTVEAVVLTCAPNPISENGELTGVGQQHVSLDDADALGRLEVAVEWLSDYAQEGQPS